MVVENTRIRQAIRQRSAALRMEELVCRVFQIFEAPEYTPEGVRTFYTFINDQAAVEGLTVYGVLEGGSIIGVLAVRDSHIALFFCG